MASMALTYPLGTLSTRSQVSKTQKTTQLAAFRKILREEGVGGLYSGISSAMFGIAVTQVGLLLLAAPVARRGEHLSCPDALLSSFLLLLLFLLLLASNKTKWNETHRNPTTTPSSTSTTTGMRRSRWPLRRPRPSVP